MTTTEKPPPPFQHNYYLGDVGRGGADVLLAAEGDERARIAAWLGIVAVESFTAAIALRKHSANRFVLDAALAIDVVQECVVTLEPLKSRIERRVHRELHLTIATGRRPKEIITLSAGAGDDEVPEEIDSLEYDLAAPLLEEFVLALDSYPRAPGVEFAVPNEPSEAKENPFAVLNRLKNRR